MFSADKEYLGLTLTETTFKAVSMRVSSQGALNVQDVCAKDIREVAEEDLPRTIEAAVRELNVRKARMFCFIPSHLVTTKNIEIPSLDPQEIRSIIDLQAGRHTPYAREEILVGYISICVFQRNYTKVLLVIVNRNVVKKQVDILSAAGVRLEKVLFAPEGLAHFYAQALKIKPEDIPVGIVHLTQDATDFVVEFNQTVATCRNIPIGLGHLIKEGDAAREQLIAEIAKSVEAYQNEDINRMPETYILTSDDVKVKELQPLLQERIKANIRIMSYLDLFQAPQPIMLKMVSEYSNDSFLDVMALAMKFDHVQVDLTPDDLKTQRALEEKGREIVKAGILFFVLLLFVTAMFFSKISSRTTFLAQLKDYYEIKHKAVIVLDAVAQKNRVLKDFLNGRMVTMDVLKTLYQLIPQEIYLENIAIEEDGTIVIRGVSESMSRVFNFVTALEESDLFKNVKTRSTTAKKDRGKDAAAFEIGFKLESAPDTPGGEATGDEAAGEEAAKP